MGDKKIFVQLPKSRALCWVFIDLSVSSSLCYSYNTVSIMQFFGDDEMRKSHAQVLGRVLKIPSCNLLVAALTLWLAKVYK